MPRLDKETIAEIKGLSKDDLEKIVLKMAAKEKSFLDFLRVNYLDKEFAASDLYEETLKEINQLFFKGYKGRSPELRAKNMLVACNKKINEFASVTKNKEMESDLLIYVLENTLDHSGARLGTCFTAYDSKIGMLLKKLITIITTKLHPDLKADYEDKINSFLKRLHGSSNHLDFVFNMPERI